MQPLGAGEPRHAGRYRLLGVLGEGGMGRVLLAVSPDGRLAAVKRIHPAFVHDQGFRERFRREVETSRRVPGAYTAAVMDADPDAAEPWLASVYVPGPSLREAVDAAGGLPLPALRRLAAGLVSALADIHRAGLVHRDLKPSNVLLAADGPRVIDFGIARAVEGGSELTHTGSVVGSPGFMSPEQAEGGPLTPASDVFSLGSLLVMAATGRSPFAGTSTPQTLYNVVHAEPELSGVPAELRSVVEPCLAKDPGRRPTLERLGELIGPVPPAATPWPAPVQHLIAARESEARFARAGDAPATGSRRGPVLAALGVAALAGAVATTALIGVTDPEAGTATPAGSAATTTATTTTSPSGSAPSGPPSPDRLRALDPCRVLGGDLEVSIAVHYSSCTYQTPAGHWIELSIGDHPPADGRPAEDVAGLPAVVERSGSPGRCEVAALIPDQPTSVISVSVGPGVADVEDPDACGTATTVLGDAVGAIRSGEGAWRSPRATLATVDPCALLPAARAEEIFDRFAGAEPSGLHQCDLQVDGTVSVTLELSTPPEKLPDTYTPVDLGGRTVHEQPEPHAVSSSCEVAWAHAPDTDNTAQVTRIRYRATATRLPVEQTCARTREAARVVLEGLPRA